MGRISRWLGIDALREEVKYLQSIIEEEYFLILDEDYQIIRDCTLKVPIGKTGILIRGEQAAIVGCTIVGAEPAIAMPKEVQ